MTGSHAAHLLHQLVTPGIDALADPLDRAAAVRDLIALLQVVERDNVVRAVLHDGATWQQVGDALGVSRQAVHKSYARAVDAALRGELRSLDVYDTAPVVPGQRTIDDELAAASPAVDDVDASGELVVVIPCSGDKLDHAAPAGQLYVGQLHRSARRAADALIARHGGRVLVLSARHGLVGLDDVLAPYDTTWADDDAVSLDELRGDVERLGAARIVSLMPAAYTARLDAAGATVDAAPIVGLRIGMARGVLRQLAAGERDL